MARGHMGICLHLGISKEQLSDLLNIVENALGGTGHQEHAQFAGEHESQGQPVKPPPFPPTLTLQAFP